MIGCTTSPVTGAAIHKIGMLSTLAPSVSKIRLTFAFCSANPNWMPRKPKLMFQMSQNDSRGLGRRALGAVATDEAMAIPGVRGFARRSSGGATRQSRGR